VNKKNIIKNVLSSTPNVISRGILNEKILLELKMSTSLYDYIEVVTNYYDERDRPEFNTWTDVEGFGYGWAWMNYEEKDWHKMMSKMVADECEGLKESVNTGYYLICDDGTYKKYHFIITDYYRVDTIVTLSNKEIW
jgi:hypothetical protein